MQLPPFVRSETGSVKRLVVASDLHSRKARLLPTLISLATRNNWTLSPLTARVRARWLLSALALVLLAPASGKAQKDTGRKMLFEIYKDQAGEYRWRLKAANGKIIAVPADAYKSKSA